MRTSGHRLSVRRENIRQGRFKVEGQSHVIVSRAHGAFELPGFIAVDDFISEECELRARRTIGAETERLGEIGISAVRQAIGQRIRIVQVAFEDFADKEPVTEIVVQSEGTQRNAQQVTVLDQLLRDCHSANPFAKGIGGTLNRRAFVECGALGVQCPFQEFPACIA